MVPLFAFVAFISVGAEGIVSDATADAPVDSYMSLIQESMSIQQVETRTYSGASTNDILLSIAAAVVIGAVVYFCLLKPSQEARNMPAAAGESGLMASMIVGASPRDEDAEDVVSRWCDEFEEDAYNLAIALIVRDLHDLASKTAKDATLRYSRIAYSVGLIMFTNFIQIYILVGTKLYVTPQQVASIRDDYQEYEKAMYANHTWLNVNGKHRGIDGFFDASLFDGLKDELKGSVCNIPLSQLSFISLILLVWSICCFAQIKQSIERFFTLILVANTTGSMADALTEGDGGEGEADGCDGAEDCDDGIEMQVITGLTLPVKAFLTVFVFVPELASTVFVLWLGSRWLVATNSFGDVLANAVALEFILALKCLIYYALVTSRNKRDLKHTGMKASWTKEPAGYIVYYASLGWLFVSVLWVYAYIQLQTVLPNYKWDVNVVCTSWLANQLNPNAK